MDTPNALASLLSLLNQHYLDGVELDLPNQRRLAASILDQHSKHTARRAQEPRTDKPPTFETLTCNEGRVS